MPGPWEKYQKQQSGPWQNYQAPASETVAQIPAPERSLGGKAVDFGVDMAKGAAKGAASTLSNIDNMVAQIPGVGRFLTTPIVGGKTSEEARANLSAKAQTHNTAQNVGKFLEQTGEFFIPGAGEEAAIAKLAPKAGKLAPLANMAVRGIGSGVVNKAQGGSFTGGAVAGAAGEALGQGLRAVAPKIAETALRVRGTDRGYGRDIGRAVLEETKGYRPATIADSAKSKIGSYMDELEHMAANQPTTATNLADARGAAKSSFNTAVAQNNEQAIRDMAELNEQLASRPIAPGVRGAPKNVSVPVSTSQAGWGGLYQRPQAAIPVPARVPIPVAVPASEAISLKRGVGALDNKWAASGAPESYTAAVHKVYNALDREIDRSLPGSARINEKVSNLTPVARRAAATDLNAGTTQRVAGRLSAHTGVLAGGAGLGATAGYKEGGLPGAVIGGSIGLVAPEIIASPEFQMAIARGAYSKGVPKATKGIGALILNALGRNSPSDQ